MLSGLDIVNLEKAAKAWRAVSCTDASMGRRGGRGSGDRLPISLHGGMRFGSFYVAEPDSNRPRVSLPAC